jgi:hypothetical protein
MLYAHAVFNLIGKNDKVLDIGGAAQPFRRADYVVDWCPYDKRQKNNSVLLQMPEHFSEKTWIQQDVCERLPFEDKSFDFAVCGHLLEDVRNPISVVREMQRVARRGYIEVPSRFYEQLLGLEHEGMCGASHHRWMTDLRKNDKGENELVFIFKSHRLHFRKNLRIKKPCLARQYRYPYIGPDYEALPLIWNGPFTVREDLEGCISGSTSFFEETTRIAKGLGKTLFNKKQATVVQYTKDAIPLGIHRLDELSGDKDRKIMIYDKRRLTTNDVRSYELELASRSN